MTTPIFFWHENGQNGCFSNWYESPFTVGGITYRHVEQYMMAQKALLFGDTETCAAIMEAKKPIRCKQLGRAVKPFDNAVWDEHKIDIVRTAVYEKFRQNPMILQALLDTGDALLAEASPYDRIWGIGLTAADAAACPPTQWRGQNLLGQILMSVRDELKATVHTDPRRA